MFKALLLVDIRLLIGLDHCTRKKVLWILIDLPIVDAKLILSIFIFKLPLRNKYIGNHFDLILRTPKQIQSMWVIHNPALMVLHVEKESSVIFISCRCKISIFSLMIKDSIWICLEIVKPVCPRIFI